jgi:hypothetical protein
MKREKIIAKGLREAVKRVIDKNKANQQSG